MNIPDLALQIFINNFNKLYASRDCPAKFQMKLDILLLNQTNALAQAGITEILRRHLPFIEEYTQDETWREKSLASEKAWIERAFYSLLKFYGIQLDWPCQ